MTYTTSSILVLCQVVAASLGTFYFDFYSYLHPHPYPSLYLSLPLLHGMLISSHALSSMKSAAAMPTNSSEVCSISFS